MASDHIQTKWRLCSYAGDKLKIIVLLIIMIIIITNNNNIHNNVYSDR